MTGHDDAPIWDGLARHLDALGASAPPPAIATVVTRRAASSSTTQFDVAGLSVAVVLVALLAVVVGPRIGASSAPPVTVVREGNFTLELRADSATYGTDQPITGVVATLTYTGPNPSVTITHADSAIGFGIVEPVNGWHLGPVWLQSCGSSVLTKDVGLTKAFGKSGSSLTEDPAFVQFMEDPVLRLPAGTWHLYAEASFNEGDCGGGGSGVHDINAQITIVVGGVGPVPAATPKPPTVAPTGPAATTPAKPSLPPPPLTSAEDAITAAEALTDIAGPWKVVGDVIEGSFADVWQGSMNDPSGAGASFMAVNAEKIVWRVRLNGPSASQQLYIEASTGTLITYIESAFPEATPANTPLASDAAAAGAFVDRYIRALVDGAFVRAWSLLGIENQGGFGSLAAFTSERKAFFESVAGRYTVTPNPTDVEPITGWVNGTNVPALDLSTAVLVKVDYPNLADNSAGWELYVVTPTADGLRLYQVR